MSENGSDSTADPSRDRLIALVEYVEHVHRLSEAPIFGLAEYRQLSYHESSLKARIGIKHDQSDEDGAIWLSIERLKRIPPPQVPDEIKPWVTVSSGPFMEPKVETVLTDTLPQDRANELVASGILEEADVQPALRPGDGNENELQPGLCDGSSLTPRLFSCLSFLPSI